MDSPGQSVDTRCLLQPGATDEHSALQGIVDNSHTSWNSGHQLKGELDRYGMVWYCPNGIANTLSMAKIRERCRVTFDSRSGNKFLVHKGDGTVQSFRQAKRGLYYLDTAAEVASSFLSTVAENKAKCNEQDYSCAVLARRIQKSIGRPSFKTFLRILEKKCLKNCPIN